MRGSASASGSMGSPCGPMISIATSATTSARAAASAGTSALAGGAGGSRRRGAGGRIGGDLGAGGGLGGSLDRGEGGLAVDLAVLALEAFVRALTDQLM